MPSRCRGRRNADSEWYYNAYRKILPSVELRIINFLSEHIHDPQKASAHFFIPGYPVQLRISFKNMKQGIHGLVCQNTVLRQFLIGFRFKVSGECSRYPTSSIHVVSIRVNSFSPAPGLLHPRWPHSKRTAHRCRMPDCRYVLWYPSGFRHSLRTSRYRHILCPDNGLSGKRSRALLPPTDSCPSTVYMRWKKTR